MQHIRYTHVTHMSHTCHTHVTHMSHTCHTHVTHMSHTCHTHAAHMSHTCKRHHHTATRCYKHAAIHCNALQHTAVHCNALQQENYRHWNTSGVAYYCNIYVTHYRGSTTLQHATTRYNTLQCNTKIIANGIYRVSPTHMSRI